MGGLFQTGGSLKQAGRMLSETSQRNFYNAPGSKRETNFCQMLPKEDAICNATSQSQKEKKQVKTGKARIYRDSKKQLKERLDKGDSVGINAKTYLEFLTMDCDFGLENPESLQTLIRKAPADLLEGLLGVLTGMQTEYPELLSNAKKLISRIEEGEELALALFAYKRLLDVAPRELFREGKWFLERTVFDSISDEAGKPNIVLKIRLLERVMQECSYDENYQLLVPGMSSLAAWASAINSIGQKEMLELMLRHSNEILRADDSAGILAALWNFSKHSKWKGEYCDIIEARMPMADRKKKSTCLFELYEEFERFVDYDLGFESWLDTRGKWKEILGLTERNWRHWLGYFFDNIQSIIELEVACPGASLFLHEKAGITFFGRYTSDTLISQYENYGKRASSKPLMLAINPLSDHNGSFYTYNFDLYDLSRKCDVKITEVGTTRQAAKSIIRSSGMYGKIDVMWVGGHGDVTAITLSDEETGQVIAENIASGGSLKKYFTKTPTLVLISCSTGSDEKGSVASMAAHRYKNVLIYAPKIPTSLYSIKLRDRDNKGRLRFDVAWAHSNAGAEFNAVE